MAIPQRFGKPAPMALPLGPTPRRAWLILRAVLVLGFLAYGWFKGYQPAVLLAVIIIGPWALLHWLRGGELEPEEPVVVQEWENPCDFGPTERQKLCDPKYLDYPQNIHSEHKNVWENYQ